MPRWLLLSVGIRHVLLTGIWIALRQHRMYCWPAEALGLGAVWTAAYPYEDRIDVVRQNTGLPENIVPLCVIPIGYRWPTESER